MANPWNLPLIRKDWEGGDNSWASRAWNALPWVNAYKTVTQPGFMNRLIETNPISTTWDAWQGIMGNAPGGHGGGGGAGGFGAPSTSSRVKPAGNSQIGTWVNGNPWATSSRVKPTTGYGAASGIRAQPTGTYGPLPAAWSGSAQGISDMLNSQKGLPAQAVQDLAKSYGIGKINLKPNTPASDTQSGGGSWGDPLTQWYDAFTQEHGGIDPVEFYGGGTWRSEEDALQQALWDKAWGDQFARTYGRGPTDDEWRSSYGHRNAMYYGGASASGG